MATAFGSEAFPSAAATFTKALTKELKLTFAKAEHLKCNATAAQDPKALFQAMRPVFNDLLTEIQRSIGYFSSIDRNATIEKSRSSGRGHENARPATLPGPEFGYRCYSRRLLSKA